MALVSAYFVVPQVGTGTELDPFYPKYTDDSRVVKWYGGEGIPYNSQTWIPVRIFVDDADGAAFDQLEAQSDAYRIRPSEIETALNALGVFPVNLTAREWALLFSKFLMPE